MQWGDCIDYKIMMTSSNGKIFRVTGHLCGEFTGPRWISRQRPVTRSFDVFFDLRLNKRLSKQSWGWWSETPSRPLWHHFNVEVITWVPSHYSDVIMSAMVSQPTSRLFTQAFVEAQNKGNIKVPHHRPLWGELTGDWWIPNTKGQ